MKNQRGFTLVEILIALSIAAVLTVSLAGVLRGAVTTWRALRAQARMDQRARVVIDRMGRDLRNAVTVPGNPFQGEPDRLSFCTVRARYGETSPEGTSLRVVLVTWRWDGANRAIVQEESDLVPWEGRDPVVRTNVTAGQVGFDYLRDGRGPPRVRVSLTFREGPREESYSADFPLSGRVAA